ncbi:MAG: DUF4145 domain-containing protein [Clostridia bacterium]|nr:DUF4145 domain-containing protein [Clostridia bacterium]
MKSVNFEYIKQLSGFESLYNCCCESECFTFQNADISVSLARKAMEYIVKMLYGSVISTDINGLTMFDMLSDPAFVIYIDDRPLLDAIHYIRKLGNQAVHQGNLTKSDAVEVLKQLHYVTGEVCVFFDLIEEYPTFNENIESNIDGQLKQDISEELSVEQKILLAFSKQLTARGLHSFSEKKEIINVHVATKNANMPARQTCGIDSAANTKAAFQNVHEWLEECLHTKIIADYSKSLLVVPNGDNVVILAVRSGCSILGNKDADENWNLLSGINYVAYAPDLMNGPPATEQLRIFSREEYIDMWKSLDLIRYKVSSGLSRKLKQIYGQTYTISAAQYADVASVQSFTNSGKKKRAVDEHFVRFPLLSCDGFDKLLK